MSESHLDTLYYPGEATINNIPSSSTDIIGDDFELLMPQSNQIEGSSIPPNYFNTNNHTQMQQLQPSPWDYLTSFQTQNQVQQRSNVANPVNTTKTYAPEECIGIYNPEQRKKRLQRHRIKRRQRQYKKEPKYASRKSICNKRPRIKGRFMKTTKKIEAPLEELLCRRSIKERMSRERKEETTEEADVSRMKKRTKLINSAEEGGQKHVLDKIVSIDAGLPNSATPQDQITKHATEKHLSDPEISKITTSQGEEVKNKTDTLLMDAEVAHFTTSPNPTLDTTKTETVVDHELNRLITSPLFETTAIPRSIDTKLDAKSNGIDTTVSLLNENSFEVSHVAASKSQIA